MEKSLFQCSYSLKRQNGRHAHIPETEAKTCVIQSLVCVWCVCVCAHIAENDYYVQKRLNTTLVRGYLKLVHIRTKK